jgi:hypothetical protein
MITGEYVSKYKRFVQGIISEDDFRRFLMLSLSKGDLIDLIIHRALSMKRAVSIGEPLQVKT